MKTWLLQSSRPTLALATILVASFGTGGRAEARWDVPGTDCEVFWHDPGRTASCVSGKIRALWDQVQELPGKLAREIDKGKTQIMGAFGDFDIMGCRMNWGNIGQTVGCIGGRLGQQFTGGMSEIKSAMSNLNLAGCRVDWGNPGKTLLCVHSKIVEGAGQIAAQINRAGEAAGTTINKWLNDNIGQKFGCTVPTSGNFVKNIGDLGLCLGSKAARAVTDFADFLKTEALKMVAEFVGRIKDSLWNFLKPLVDRTKSVINSWLDRLAREAVDAILGSHVAKWVQEAVSRGKDAYGTLKVRLAQLDSLLEEFALDHLIDFVKGVGVAEILKFLQPVLKNLLDWSKQFFAVYRNVIQGVIGTVPFAGGPIAGALGYVYDLALGMILDAVEKAASGFIADFGTNMGANLKTLIKDNINAPGTPLGQLAGIVREPLKQLVAKMRPYLGPIMGLADQLRGAASSGGFDTPPLKK